MFNGREKLGADAAVDWKTAALGVGKNRRKTIGRESSRKSYSGPHIKVR